jgi:hypothetical protein
VKFPTEGGGAFPFHQQQIHSESDPNALKHEINQLRKPTNCEPHSLKGKVSGNFQSFLISGSQLTTWQFGNQFDTL